jgi:hypothetical protein
VPGTITAARVLLGLSLAGDVLMALLGVGGALLVASLSAALPDDGTADGARLLVGCVLLVGVSVVSIWVTRRALGPLADGDPAARSEVTILLFAATVAIALADVVMGAGMGAFLVQLLIPSPAEIAILVLLWVPVSSRRHFGDPVLEAGGPHRSPASAAPGWLDAPTVSLARTPPSGAATAATAPSVPGGPRRPW